MEFAMLTRIVKPVLKIVEDGKRTTGNTGFVAAGRLLAPTNVAVREAFSVLVMHHVQLHLSLPSRQTLTIQTILRILPRALALSYVLLLRKSSLSCSAIFITGR